MTTRKTKPASTLSQSVQAQLEQRHATAERDLQEAIAGQRWSQLPGLHGLVEGLAAARRHVHAEGEALDADGFKRLATAFGQNAQECDGLRAAALSQERYADVPVHDGVGTGWATAKKLIEECLAR